VVITRQMRAKLLDPPIAGLVTGILPVPAVTFRDDMKELTQLLWGMLSKICFCDRLITISSFCDMKLDCQDGPLRNNFLSLSMVYAKLRNTPVLNVGRSYGMLQRNDRCIVQLLEY
jgi:hypothetical protein